MPLHLLGKKSWNVYNTDNVEKVKRDEARALAIEEAEEQRMQELDAKRRIQILRGEEPTPLPLPSPTEHNNDEGSKRDASHGGYTGRKNKIRRKAGENETDYEMRLALSTQQSTTQASPSNRETQLVLHKPTKDQNNTPITDSAGHISLFPQHHPSNSREEKKVEKNPEAERELAKKRKEYEDQYTLRFSNAAGFKQGLENPWYSKPTSTLTSSALVSEKELGEGGEVAGKDVWGNEDPRRKEREMKRIVDNDPLAMMRQGAAQVRKVERERKRWREEKEREIKELEEAEEERRRAKRLKRRREDEEQGRESHKARKAERERDRDEDRERRHRHRSRESRRDYYRYNDRRH